MQSNLTLKELEERLKKLEYRLTPIEKKLFSRKYSDKELYRVIKELLPYYVEISPAMIQRMFSVSYERAIDVIDKLESENLIEKPDGAKPRKVYKEDKR